VTISLPEKLYFYHSTAECFFSGALASLLGYFIWIVNGGPNRFSIMGLGFVFGVGSILLFFVSSLLMALDDIMRSCRTSILYTDEMASIYASSHPKAAPDVSAAAKAFASAGASGGASKKAASTNGQSKPNNQNGNNPANKITDKDNGKNIAENKDGRIPHASKGSEMVTGTVSVQKTEDFYDARTDRYQAIHDCSNTESNYRSVAFPVTTTTTDATVDPFSWEPIYNDDEQTDFYSVSNDVGDPVIGDPSIKYPEYEERHYYTTAPS